MGRDGVMVMVNTQPVKLILDTDPGGDDLFAILWLVSLVNQGLAELVAVTTTAGNVAADQTFRNASQLLQLVGLADVEVGRGAPNTSPSQSASHATHIHGADGMGNLSQQWPAPTRQFAAARSSPDILIQALMAQPGVVTLVAIGPLTNLAVAELQQPGILRQAKQVVVMGGAVDHEGNITPLAEFNSWFDPEALAVVLNSGADLVLLPLDVTSQLLFTPAMAQTIAQVQPRSPLAPLLIELLIELLIQLCDFMTGTALAYRETQGIPGFLVHDAATVGYLFYPDCLMFRRALVQVETQGEATRGQTWRDRRPTAHPHTNVWLACQVDPTGFFTHLLADLQMLLRRASEQ